MNVVYVGYRSWSFDILKKLLKHQGSEWRVTGVLTTSDAEADFERLPVPVTRLSDPKTLTLRSFGKYKPGVILFYGWSWIIPEEIWTKYPCLIYHISPLPKYRGGSPIQHQIINGETTSAGTLFRAVGDIDAGPIYSQTPISLKGNVGDIFNRIVRTGLTDTRNVLSGIVRGDIIPLPQDDTKKTVYKRRKPAESELTVHDFKTKSAEELYNFIRALGDPYPNAYIVCKDGRKLYFTGAKLGK